MSTSDQTRLLIVEDVPQVAQYIRGLLNAQSQVKVLAEIQLEKIQATIAAQQPAVAVIDSIQTVYSDQLTSAPGSVACSTPSPR